MQALASRPLSLLAGWEVTCRVRPRPRLPVPWPKSPPRSVRPESPASSPGKMRPSRCRVPGSPCELPHSPPTFFLAGGPARKLPTDPVGAVLPGKVRTEGADPDRSSAHFPRDRHRHVLHVVVRGAWEVTDSHGLTLFAAAAGATSFSKQSASLPLNLQEGGNRCSTRRGHRRI